jgi:hypothetical protein
MKKIILLVLITFNSFCIAQKLTITPTGLKDANDNEKTFVVIPVEGKTAKQLYDDAIKYITKTYKNPDNVIKGRTEGEYLKFHTYAPRFIFIRNGMKVYFDAEYITELSFKDGKVKYEIVDLEMHNPDNNNPLVFSGGTFDWSIYNKKGEVKKEDAKTDFDNYFNSQIQSLSTFLQGKATDDKW